MSTKLNEKGLSPFTGIIIFTLVAIIGFAYVKWIPYYAKALFAQSHHNIGNSILAGKSTTAPAASWHAAAGYAMAYGKAIWLALILGLVLGSGIKVLLPSHWIKTILGRLGLKSAVLSGLFAIPCMMCTCCSAPMAIGMRQSRASIGSVVSWWISNPVLNPATLVFMGFVLGWDWTLFRIVFGVIMILSVAYLAEHFSKPHDVASEPNVLPAPETLTGSFWARWGQEFMTLTVRLVPEYIVIVLLLGAARAWLFPVLNPHDTFGWIAAMAVAGTLFVVPTAGEVPIIQGMLALGMGAGPAGALIMTLPAVSLPSLVMLGRVFSIQTRLVIAASVAFSGILAGFIAMTLF